MAARTRITVADDTNEDEAALSGDRQREAETLADTLDALRSISGADTKIIVSKIPHANGKFEHCFDMQPPVDTSALMTDLRERFGPGQYVAAVMKAGKLFTRMHFAIAAELKLATAVQPQNVGGSSDMLLAMMNMQQRSSDMMMQMQSQSADRQMQMFTGLITALVGQPKESATDLLGAFGAMQGLMPKPASLMDDLEKVKVLKELFGGDGKESGTPDSIIGLISQAAPHVMGALGKGVDAAREVIASRTGAGQPAMLPGPQQPPSPQPLPQPAAIADPILALVGPDMMFFAWRGYDVEEASDIIADKLDAAGITEDALLTLVTRIGAAGERWLEALAGEGVDLRPYPEWAQQCLALIHAKLSQPADDSTGDGESETGGAGGASNP